MEVGNVANTDQLFYNIFMEHSDHAEVSEREVLQALDQILAREEQKNTGKQYRLCEDLLRETRGRLALELSGSSAIPPSLTLLDEALHVAPDDETSQAILAVRGDIQRLSAACVGSETTSMAVRKHIAPSEVRRIIKALMTHLRPDTSSVAEHWRSGCRHCRESFEHILADMGVSKWDALKIYMEPLDDVIRGRR